MLVFQKFKGHSNPWEERPRNQQYPYREAVESKKEANSWRRWPTVNCHDPATSVTEPTSMPTFLKYSGLNWTHTMVGYHSEPLTGETNICVLKINWGLPLCTWTPRNRLTCRRNRDMLLNESCSEGSWTMRFTVSSWWLMTQHAH